MAEIIEMRNVSFSAQKLEIVRDFSCLFDEGKVTALIGPSGSGKSTVLKLSAGILVPDEGEIYYRDREIFSMSRQENLAFRRDSAMVFQDSALWANQSIYQILELPLLVHFPAMDNKDRGERIREVLGEVAYRRDLSIRPSQLSMGEQKLIAFARALMCKPKLLYLDEWTESLDETASRRLIQIVRRYKEEQSTIIFVCHDFRIIKTLADFLVMVVGGKFSIKVSREQMEEDEALAQHLEQGIASL